MNPRVCRVAALPAGARALLEVVAVAGHPVRQGVAWRATGVHPDGQDVLTLLRTARLLRSTGPGEQDLLDVVQGSAMTCLGELDGALGPLRRVRKSIARDGGIWLRNAWE